MSSLGSRAGWVMRLHVSFEVAALIEGRVTQVALEGPHARVKARVRVEV
jgi:hypothetical protein